MNIVLPLPEKVSTNQIYAGVHWSRRNALADLYHMSLIEHKRLKVKSYPVKITYIFKFRGRLLDPDNCSYMAKLLKDGLRKWGIIKDDTSEYVKSVTLISEKGKRDEVEIVID